MGVRMKQGLDCNGCDGRMKDGVLKGKRMQNWGDDRRAQDEHRAQGWLLERAGEKPRRALGGEPARTCERRRADESE